MPAVTIDDDSFKEVLSEVGHPLLQEEDLPGLTYDDLKANCIFPAMRTYFEWKPIRTNTSQMITMKFEIPFPDPFIYGVTDVRVAPYYNGKVVTGNPFMDARIVERNPDLRSVRASGIYVGQDTKLMEEIERRSWINLRKTGRVDIDYQNRILKGSTTVAGELVVTWASYSLNFGDIPFQDQSTVLKLCKAFVLRYLGMLRQQQVDNTGVQLESGPFLDRADKLEEEVMTRFKNRTKVVILR